jgi:hypothetical protein
MTEADNTRHNPTIDLSDRQVAAIAVLVASGTQTDAAEASGVTRQTVNEWANHHYGFIAELNRLRTERLQSCAERLQTAVGKALQLVTTQIDEGHTTVALGLLKLVGVDHLRTARTSEPSTPDSVRRQLMRDAYLDLLEDGDFPDFMDTRVDREAKRAFDNGHPLPEHRITDP